MREEMKVRIYVWIVIVAVLLIVFGIGWSVAHGQTPPAALQPTEVQSLRLQVKQREFQIASILYNQALAALDNEAENIKKENHWDEKVRFLREQMIFLPAPELPKVAAPVTPPVTPPAPKAKP
jgi:hypothetical protein